MSEVNLNDFDAVLAHHGVKGQKWGVRRARAVSAARTTGHVTAVGVRGTSHATSAVLKTKAGKAIAASILVTSGALVVGHLAGAHVNVSI